VTGIETESQRNVGQQWTISYKFLW
jgi:hypothetical protein